VNIGARLFVLTVFIESLKWLWKVWVILRCLYLSRISRLHQSFKVLKCLMEVSLGDRSEEACLRNLNDCTFVTFQIILYVEALIFIAEK
jgi:hypothetical protein